MNESVPVKGRIEVVPSNSVSTSKWYRSGNLEAMTWEEFQELFMGKYFLTLARHAKAREFLELRQGAMMLLEYVAKFTELAHFADDYVNTDMTKVRKFEDGLKLSIWDKIVGLLLHYMNSMVRIALAIEMEVEDAQSILEVGAIVKRKESQPSSSSLRKKQRIYAMRGFQRQGRGHQG